jgi:quercetin dioxygenase-like cupin family protein
VLATAGEGARFWLPGGFDRIRLTAGQTGGVLGITESEEASGDAPPLHVHTHEDETYFVVEGTYTFFIGDQTLTAESGSVVFAPRGIPHTYRIESPAARYICVITPGGWEGFFADAGIPAADPDFVPPAADPDFDRIGAIAERFGVSILGPPPL